MMRAQGAKHVAADKRGWFPSSQALTGIHRREKGPTLSLSMSLAQSGGSVYYCTGSLGLLVLHRALRRLEVGQMATCHLKEL